MQVPYNSSTGPGFSASNSSSSSSNTNNTRESLKSILSTVGLLLIAPLIAVFLVIFVFQSYEVDGQSMETTLQNGDRLIVLKLPRTAARLSRQTYVPHRGDIVIFNLHPLQDIDSTERQLIKRVIALPGERVVVDEDGKITVFNKANPAGFNPDKTLPYGSVIQPSALDRQVDYTLGEDQVFVCGDNRNNSRDSRYFGPISANDIVGKLGLRIYPFTKTQIF